MTSPLRQVMVFAFAVAVALPVPSAAQMTYRLKGTVKDNDGKTVTGIKVRAEAIIGFRGEQFVGQKEFETTTNGKGEWTVLGLTSGIWSFEATGPDVIPQVVLIPVNFTNRKPQSGAGGSFPWDLPLWVRRTRHEGLTLAAKAAMARRADEAAASLGVIVGQEQDPDLLCSAGEVALLVRQNGLGRAIFDQIVKAHPKHGCATRGLASAALMQGDYDMAAKMIWAAIDLVPREQRAAFGAASKDLQQISGAK